MAKSEDLSASHALLVAARTSWRAIHDAAREGSRWFAIAAVLSLCHALVPPAEVWLLKRLIDQISAPDRDPRQLLLALAGLTVAVGLNFSIGYLALTASQRTGLRLGWYYRAKLAHAAAALEPRRLADPQVTTDLQVADIAIAPMTRAPGMALQLIGTAITAAGLCVAIFSFSPAAGLLALAALLPTVVAMTFIARVEARGWPPVAAVQRRSAYAMEQLLQQRSGTELALLGTGHKVADRVSREQRQGMILLDKVLAADMRWETAASVGTAVLLAAALWALVVTDAGAALAAAAIAGILSGLSAIRFTGHAFGNLVSLAPQAETYERTVTDASHQARVRPGARAGRLEVDRLTVRYPGASGPAVDDVSLAVERGEMIALVGVNGAGKTTTINSIIGVVSGEAGTIRIDAQQIQAPLDPETSAKFGLLIQEFGRYEFTVRDVVGLGTSAENYSDDQIWVALDKARIGGRIRDLPDGLDTQLGQQWGGVGLSGGQWQRLALARIYLRDAGVWILDEPTSAIDAEAEAEIFAALQQDKHDRITIVVSHRAWTLRGMDRIYVFDHGRIVQVGTFSELLNQPGRFAELFAEQLSPQP
ncbi:ABC transporter ATP-binding protein [Microlunatus elymi]|uniref:ABC transporter ATP-binding protein n=1 Tax=Microlunatus elymi TaxID=2596828 RepID=A0A516PVT5_9ACTN|nr:ABC transporter ATP-binding protein [Microlunatus elymi]QDP95297.1 ABC transporter ATP-binding protein [Microlunatus elymi]